MLLCTTPAPCVRVKLKGTLLKTQEGLPAPLPPLGTRAFSPSSHLLSGSFTEDSHLQSRSQAARQRRAVRTDLLFAHPLRCLLRVPVLTEAAMP